VFVIYVSICLYLVVIKLVELLSMAFCLVSPLVLVSSLDESLMRLHNNSSVLSSIRIIYALFCEPVSPYADSV